MINMSLVNGLDSMLWEWGPYELCGDSQRP